jgi:hypothetical protein
MCPTAPPYPIRYVRPGEWVIMPNWRLGRPFKRIRSWTRSRRTRETSRRDKLHVRKLCLSMMTACKQRCLVQAHPTGAINNRCWGLEAPVSANEAAPGPSKPDGARASRQNACEVAPMKCATARDSNRDTAARNRISMQVRKNRRLGLDRASRDLREPSSGKAAGPLLPLAQAASKPSKAEAASKVAGRWQPYSLTCTSRPFRGWTGRAFIGYSFLNAASCLAEISLVVFSTCQRTPSLHGGVVSEPLKA